MSSLYKAGIGILFLGFVGVTIVFPSVPVSLIHYVAELLKRADLALPFVPLCLYAVLAVVLQIRGKLFEVPRDELQKDLDRQQLASLTLTGFCFTSLGLLMSYFKEEIKSRQTGPESILFFFVVALGSFILSYMVLRFRGKRVYALVSDASIDNGIWCILLGFWSFSQQTPGLERLPIIFVLSLAGYLLLVILHFNYYFRLR